MIIIEYEVEYEWNVDIILLSVYNFINWCLLFKKLVFNFVCCIVCSLVINF